MLNKEFFAQRFLAMLEGNQIITITSNGRVKILGANNFQRFDFTEFVADCLHIFGNKPRSIKGDACDLLDKTLKHLIDNGKCDFIFKEDYDRYAYCDSHSFKYYM